MSYKPDEATLISYLYGELEGEELKKVEEYLEVNPQEKNRIKEWSFTRAAMSRLEDKEVIAPPIILSEDGRPMWRESYFRMTVGIAASLLFLLVAAKFLGLSATFSGQELKIGFGTSSKSTPPLTEQQVDEMIQHSIRNNNETLQASWSDDRRLLEQSMQKSVNINSAKINNLVRQASNASQEEVRQFVGQLQKENYKMMSEYLQLSTTGQKQYLEGLLVDFSKYLQEQRKQDLQLFQTRMSSYEQNTDQFKQETEQILSSLITNGPNNQRRN